MTEKIQPPKPVDRSRLMVFAGLAAAATSGACLGPPPTDNPGVYSPRSPVVDRDIGGGGDGGGGGGGGGGHSH